MSNTQLLQWLQSANGRVPSDAINRTARSVWQTVSAPLKALFAIGEDPSSPPSSVFIADAFLPEADGASSTITLRRGLALQIDSSIGGTWDGDVKPLYADADQVVSFTQNTDASGDDRIDLLVIRPDVEEEDPQTVSHKDTLEGPVYTKTVNTRRNLGFELDVIEGTPNAAPTAPSTPSGWVAICEVTRPNGQAAVLAGDVEDVRQREFVASLGVGKLYFGDPSGNHYVFERDDDDAPTLVRLRNQAGADADLSVQDLIATGEVRTGELHSDVADEGIDVYEPGGSGSGYSHVVAKNAPIAMARFHFPDPGGALTDNDPATIGYDLNIDTIVYKDDTTDYALVTFDFAIPEEGNAVVVVSPGQRISGGAAPVDDLVSAYVEGGGATARVYWASGAVPLDQHYHLVVYGAG